MPAVYSSPGVYVEEIATLAPSVAEVSTAVPAFLGYTETGDALTPTRIQNLREYEQTFGGPPQVVTSVTVNTNAAGAVTYTPTLTTEANTPVLYYSLRLYFDNGGGPCYIVSLGAHGDAAALDKFTAALAALRTEDEPTLIVMPDATRLGAGDFSAACAAALDHCGLMRDRFALLDVKREQSAADFRKLSSDSLAYGAAYTPFLDTSLAYAFDETKLTVLSSSAAAFSGTVGGLPVTCAATADKTPSVEIAAGSTNDITFATDTTPKLTVTAPATATSKQVSDAWATWKKATANAANGFDIPAGDATVVTVAKGVLEAPKTLSSLKARDTGVYNQMKAALAADPNLRATLPASGAMAGIYARVDRDRGVWKAPANVAVASVLGLDRSFTNDDLDDLNVDSKGGKSINAIRSFTGRGILVWGARTLAGNDNEWRYVPVRRLFIMIEESALRATAFAVFEPNTAETWLKVRAMIESFLYGLWERGALSGSKPEDAYFVNVGLGTTMTAQDILEGRMIVKVGVAAVRPAEFIILQFSHKMQEA